jgi:hypothetical protein
MALQGRRRLVAGWAAALGGSVGGGAWRHGGGGARPGGVGAGRGARRRGGGVGAAGSGPAAWARVRREKGSERREEERKTTGVLFNGFAECQIAGTRQRIF